MTTTGSIATGTFEVSFEARPSEVGDLAVLSRQVVSKVFSGDLDARSSAEMLSWTDPSQQSGAYVALEVISGTLWGRRGRFVVAHLGTADEGAQRLELVIVPGSGTDELAGLAGTMGIEIVDGVHHYRLTAA